MNLNPISWVVDGVASVVSSYQTSKQARVEAKSAVKEKKVEYKLAKWQAKISLLKAQGRHDASYDMQVLKNRQVTWLDEVLGISIILMTILAFVPGVAPYIKEGWAAVSQAPFWFQFAWYTLIASTLGGLTILRVLMGAQVKRGASMPQDQRATYPESHPDNSQTQDLAYKQSPQDQPHTSASRAERADHKEESSSESLSSQEEQESREQPDKPQHRPTRRPGPPHGGGR